MANVYPWRRPPLLCDPLGMFLELALEFTFEAANGGMLMTMIQRGIPTDELWAERARGVPNAFGRLEQHVRGRPTQPTQT